MFLTSNPTAFYKAFLNINKENSMPFLYTNNLDVLSITKGENSELFLIIYKADLPSDRAIMTLMHKYDKRNKIHTNRF